MEVLAGLVISSSWIVEDGWTTQIAGVVKKVRKKHGLRLRKNRCSACGELGHTSRSPKCPKRASSGSPQPGAPVEQPQGEALLDLSEGTTSEAGDEETGADVGHETAASCEAV